MFLKVLLFASIFIIGIRSRFVHLKEKPLLIEDTKLDPDHVQRVRRQAQGSITISSNGLKIPNIQISIKDPLVEDKDRVLSAIGSTSLKATSGGLMLETEKGSSLLATKEYSQSFGNSLNVTGTLNVLNGKKLGVSTKAFVNHNMPKAELHSRNFNTLGLGFDATYKDKIGAGATAARTGLLNRTFVSAFGNYNLFKTPSHSLDLNAGVGRSYTRHNKTSWQPFGRITYTF